MKYMVKNEGEVALLDSIFNTVRLSQQLQWLACQGYLRDSMSAGGPCRALRLLPQTLHDVICIFRLFPYPLTTRTREIH